MRISDWSSDVCSSDLRLQGEGGRKIGYLRPDIVEQFAGVALLTHFAVDEAANTKCVRIFDLISGDDPRSDRSMGVARLADGVGRGMLMPVARGRVVAVLLTEDMSVRVPLRSSEGLLVRIEMVDIGR